jgi:hypothetical protein
VHNFGANGKYALAQRIEPISDQGAEHNNRTGHWFCPITRHTSFGDDSKTPHRGLIRSGDAGGSRSLGRAQNFVIPRGAFHFDVPLCVTHPQHLLVEFANAGLGHLFE